MGVRSSLSLESGEIRETCHKQKQTLRLPVVNLFLIEMSEKFHCNHFPPNSTRLKNELAIKGEKKKPSMKFQPCRYAPLVAVSALNLPLRSVVSPPDPPSAVNQKIKPINIY